VIRFCLLIATILFQVFVAIPKSAASPVACVSEALMDLMNEGGTRHQNWPSLQASGHIPVTGSRLCGPTCAFNLLEALRSKLGLPLRHEFEIAREVDYIIELLKNKANVRIGLTPELLNEYLATRFKEAGIDVQIGLLKKATPIRISDLTPPNRTSILAYWYEEDGSRTSHFVIVQSIDTSSNTMKIMDPNYHAKTRELKYSSVRDPDGNETLQFLPSDKPGKRYYSMAINYIDDLDKAASRVRLKSQSAEWGNAANRAQSSNPTKWADTLEYNKTTGKYRDPKTGLSHSWAAVWVTTLDYNQTTGLYRDPRTGLFYSWATINHFKKLENPTQIPLPVQP